MPIGGQVRAPVAAENDISTGSPVFVTQPGAHLHHNCLTPAPGFVDASRYEHRLRASSPCRRAGRRPGSVQGFSLGPRFQYAGIARPGPPHRRRGDRRRVRGKGTVMGTLLRRTVDGDEVLAEWSPDDPGSVRAAEDEYRRWLEEDYEAVQSDGTHYQPIEGDAFPVDAAQVVLSTGMGGG